MKLISWNMRHRTEAWRPLLESDADLALVQEACAPPSDIASRIVVDDAPWRTAGVDANRSWRTAVVRLSNRVQVNWHRSYRIDEARAGQLAVSRPGTLAAADVVMS